MTTSATAEAEAGAPYAPASAGLPVPPPSSEGEEVFSLDDIARKLWDEVAIFGPLTRAQLHETRPQASLNYRQFVRYHPEIKLRTRTPAILQQADRWMRDQMIERSLRHGWLVELDDQTIVTGTVPPEHQPLSTRTGGGTLAGLRAELERLDVNQAMQILLAKTQVAWNRADREGTTRLRRSLERIGQLEPIVIWAPPKQVMTGVVNLPSVLSGEVRTEAEGVHVKTVEDRIIVNGVTRYEILTRSRGGSAPKIPWIREIPAATSPVEVLFMRIEHEIAGSSKDMSRTACDSYVERLTEAGVDHGEMTRRFAANQERAAQVRAKYASVGTVAKPTETDEARFVELRNQGWKPRDISTETGWSKTTVERYLAKADLPVEDGKKIQLPKGHKLLLMQHWVALGRPASLREVYTLAGLDHNNVAKSDSQLAQTGWLEKVTSYRGKDAAGKYQATPRALRYIDPADQVSLEALSREYQKFLERAALAGFSEADFR